ncbi:hypothetical protein CRV24_007541 [Beauveria bassiana]|nr:hypothetical protein CRV24_007541 [Beauveria bassiana]KAH8715573.1 hypothetical protein HC256_004382 [Beauveria bassiana]KAH8715574.1 hypothetical protein HC256_004382 [Beauveria bassiana]
MPCLPPASDAVRQFVDATGVEKERGGTSWWDAVLVKASESCGREGRPERRDFRGTMPLLQYRYSMVTGFLAFKGERHLETFLVWIRRTAGGRAHHGSETTSAVEEGKARRIRQDSTSF